jgi:hypothetical protein
LFHKPGDTINSGNSSPNTIKIPWGIDFSNCNPSITLPLNASDVLLSDGETLEDWVINSSEFIPDMASEQAGYKMEELKNILDPRITALETAASNPPIQTTASIFHQSIINHTAMFTTYNGVYATVTSNSTFPTTIKTTVRDTDPIIFPRTINTLITKYYSSYVDNYIPSCADNMNKSLVSYYSTVEVSTELFYIGVINSTVNTPGILIRLKNADGSTYKTNVVIKILYLHMQEARLISSKIVLYF